MKQEVKEAVNTEPVADLSQLTPAQIDERISTLSSFIIQLQELRILSVAKQEMASIRQQMRMNSTCLFESNAQLEAGKQRMEELLKLIGEKEAALVRKFGPTREAVRPKSKRARR